MSEDRATLHKQVWQMAEDMRGSVSSWDFKQYVSAILFYRFVSDRLLPNELKFERVREINTDLAYTLHRVFKIIEQSLPKLFDDVDLASGMLGNSESKRRDKLKALMDAVDNLIDMKDSSIDVMGDVYEYILMMYSKNGGQKSGEFFTPQGLSILLSRLVSASGRQPDRIYDPTCGSGSLLMAFAKHAGDRDIKMHGQEINLTTYNMCRMNMFLRHLANPQLDFEIAHGDTLTEPHDWSDVRFDAIVGNPPYSVSWPSTTDSNLAKDPRFSPAALAPKTKADLAFVMHVMHHLADDGIAALVMFPGAIYRLGAEAQIRRYLLEQNYVDAVIQMPQNLFMSTGIGVSVLVMRKGRNKDDKVLMIMAENECVRDKAQNYLRTQHIDKIVQCYEGRSEIKYFSKLIEPSEIIDTDCNLSPRLYVDAKPQDDDMTIEEARALTERCKYMSEYKYQKHRLMDKAFDKFLDDLEAGIPARESKFMDEVIPEYEKLKKEKAAELKELLKTKARLQKIRDDKAKAQA